MEKGSREPKRAVGGEGSEEARPEGEMTDRDRHGGERETDTQKVSDRERYTDGDSKRDKKDGERPNKERARDIRC